MNDQPSESQTTEPPKVVSLDDERRKKREAEDARHFSIILKLVGNFK